MREYGTQMTQMGMMGANLKECGSLLLGMQIKLG